VVADSSKNIDVNKESDENINNNNKAKGKRGKRLRISDSDSDVAEDISKSGAENEITKVPRLSMQKSSQHSQRPRRSVARSTRYADYEVEDLPQRPENVWITEKPVGKDFNLSLVHSPHIKIFFYCLYNFVMNITYIITIITMLHVSLSFYVVINIGM
jgi:hypothetical protein